MALLILFAFLAGVATIFAPCILPVLPVVLSAGISGGKQRPLGIVAGLVASFTFFTLSLSWLTRHLGVSPDGLRLFAIVVILIFGIMLLVPKILSAFEGFISKVIPQVKADSTRSDFLGGILIGVSLGLVWTPCVGPIVASVISLAASSAVTLTSVLITAAYALGTSVPLLVLTYGGQGMLRRLRSANKAIPKVQMAFGAIMVLTAVAMLFGLDRTLQSTLLAKLPSSISSGLTQQLERSDLVKGQLKKLNNNGDNTMPSSSQIVGGASSGLPVLGKAPEFTGITGWLNSDPVTLESLKGKVVLVDFWTYSCINCIRTLPHVTAWYDTYKDQGFVVVGVHAPEFAFEKDSKNVAAAIKERNIHYPVAQDNDFATWRAYDNQYWPAEYLIDAEGRVRETHFGEGNYAETETNIRSLLKEAKVAALPAVVAPSVADTTPTSRQSPETYLGLNRRARFSPISDSTKLAYNEWNLTGNWQSGSDVITSGAAQDSLSFRFTGKEVYLVMNPPRGATGTVHVLLDGKDVGTAGGVDVKNSSVLVSEDRLYHLVHLENAGSWHILSLIFETPGVEAFAFTFG
jgi:cytochrome c biogenesis protein CcdA/thiol-disulfide isomerase/thioredoxin